MRSGTRGTRGNAERGFSERGRRLRLRRLARGCGAGPGRAAGAALALALLVLLAAAGCDRRIEPYDPNEEPHPPDLSKLFPPEREATQEMAQNGAGAAPQPQQRGAPPVGSETAAAGDPTAEASPIRGTVQVAPDLEGAVGDGAVLFVMARRAENMPPLAVKRVMSPSLPYAFELGPDDRMIRQMPFEGPVTISARLDADGDASTRSPGDLQGQAEGSVNPGAFSVVVTLDEQL